MGGITQAVEAASQAPAKVTPQSVIKGKIETYRPVIAKLLDGTGVNMETFVAQVANAFRAQPQLWKCDPDTVLGAALKCAQLGLAPNDNRNLAWIVPYGNQAQFQLGYGGIMELARRAAPGLRFEGRPVYPNDVFEVDYGRAEPITHKPAVSLGLPRGGPAYAWYVVAHYPDGGKHVEVLDPERVEYHRGFSKQPNGKMWTDSYDAAALKSVVVEMRRFLPSSTTLAAALSADETVVDIRNVDDDEITDAEVVGE